MEVETLGDAFTHSWRITARCSGGVEDMHPSRKTVFKRTFSSPFFSQSLVKTRPGVAWCALG
jgi:hypothetical protein